MAYGTLAARLSLHVQAVPNAPRRDPASYRTLGTPLPRIDIRAKLTGGEAYVHDLRLPGMLHARVVRGPSFGTRLKELDLSAIGEISGVQVVQRGAFTALVAEREWTVIQALKRLERSDFVRTAGPLPQGGVVATLKALSSTDISILDTHGTAPPAVRTLSARYTRPWLYHGSIGPSCAVALVKEDQLTVWTHSQGVFNARRAIADLLHWPLDRVRCIHTEGSGCYGHNGADDVAAEAALIAQALPGRPIRLQWMREQEFGWEPLGPAMVGELQAGIDDKHRIVDWHHELWSNEHNARPVDAGGVLVGADLGFALPESKLIPMPEGGASRNSNPLYVLPNASVVYHFVSERPLRVSALRALGAYFNVFCIESMLDELAHAADMDPLELRLAHLQDERARTVLQVAAKAFGWSERVRGDGRQGYGMAFARYKNLASYCALFMQVEVDHQTGRIGVRRVVAAVDSGQVANPDGLRNQIEGGIVQSLSWTMHEAVSFDTQQRTARSWAAYPILRFTDVPDTIEVHIVPRDGLPFLGAGEAAQGPTAAALANALADATGMRLRDLPLGSERLKAALEQTHT
jgi:CO/xanthine dehydrogenase Mo-binding subunit